MSTKSLCQTAWGRLKPQAGAFDLPSIMIGVAVVAILTVGVLAAIFGVIPWAQDRSAQQDLAAVNTAQGVVYSKDGGFEGGAGLIEAKLLGSEMPTGLEIKASGGECYVAVRRSETGTKFVASSTEQTPRGLFNTDTWCDGQVVDAKAPAPPEKVFSDTLSDISSLNQVAVLNNGGTLKSTATGVFITGQHGAEPRKLEGIDSALTGTLNTEASPDGKTVIVFNNQWAQVSWDGGATWTVPRQATHFATGRPYQRAAVSGDGSTVLISSATLSHANYLAIIDRSTGAWVEKPSGLHNYSALSTNGATAIEANVASSGYVKKIDSSLSGNYSTVPTLSGANYTGFDTSGDLAAMALSMRAYHASYGNVQKLFISRDAGATWEVALDGTFRHVNVSSTGSRMVAISGTDIHVSKDGGFSWTVVDPIGGVGASSLELSEDGKTMVIRGADNRTYLASVAR